MNKRGLVSVVIVNWNGVVHLKKCIPSIYKQNYKNFEIILVDNGSLDGSVEWISRKYPQIKIIKNKKNLGFAEGNNQGYREAYGEYILFLNNDTLVTKGFLSELVRALKKDSKIGGVQSKILFMDSPEQLDSVGSYLTNTGFLYHVGVYARDSEEYNKEIDVFSAKGACLMFRSDVLKKVEVEDELFDSRYFAYFEETDLCHRVWLAGYRIVYIPKSKILHKFGATSQRLLKPFVEYHSYKNRINTYIKNLGTSSLLKILTVHLLIIEALSLVFVMRRKFSIALGIQKAVLWNIVNLYGTLKKRRVVQRRVRKVEDDIILPYITRNPNPSYYLNQIRGWNVTQIDK